MNIAKGQVVKALMFAGLLSAATASSAFGFGWGGSNNCCYNRCNTCYTNTCYQPCYYNSCGYRYYRGGCGSRACWF